MNEIKHSALLKKAMERAKVVGSNSSQVVTAERFVAAVGYLVQESSGSADPELRELTSRLYQAIPNLGPAMEMLLTHIDEGRGATFLSDLYMKKRLQEAAIMVGSNSGAEVTTVALLECILKNPSDAIQGAMAARAAQTPPPRPQPPTPAPADPRPTGGNGAQSGGLSADAIIAQLSAIMSAGEKKEGTPPPAQTPKTKPAPSPAVPPEPQTQAEAQVAEEPPVDRKPMPEDVKGEVASLVTEVKRIRSTLQETVFGQDKAINVLVTGYFQARMLSMIDKSRKRPRATFLFAGSPGVGKTFLAETSAEALGLPFMRFDMSEYADKEANIEFCGSDKVYKNGKPGNVTSFVAENPKCVLLFDEIEKAHMCVIYLFLQMLDAGRLRDNFTDKEVSFSEAILIFTTNAGRQLYEESESGDLSNISRKVIMQALQTDINPQTGAPYFPGALCSRFASGNVVMFNHIGAHNLRDIAKREIQRHAANLEKETGIQMQIDERVFTALLFSEGSSADARTIRSRAEAFFNDELYELLRLISSEKVKTEIDNLERIQITLDLSNSGDDIAEMFASSAKTEVLVFAAPETVGLCRQKAPAFEIHGAQTAQEAIELMKTRELGVVLLDMKCGASEASLANLNLEDVESPARDFFKFLKSQGHGVPVYLLEGRDTVLSEEEKESFIRQGVRGVMRVLEGRDTFEQDLVTVATSLYQQANMVRLARENKLISFETAQSISQNGKRAEIKLFDFRMGVAVDSEDSKSILSAASIPDICFDDVIGAREAKKELAYFVAYLKNPKKYMGTGVKAPKGVLLYGPPGTGKTMLAKAMAHEAGVTFIAAEGNQFLKKYVGEGSETVHELFKTARKYAPSILFIDEIDAIAKERRGGEFSNGSEATLTAFLAEMDGFASDPTKPVFVLAATNFDVEPGGAKSLDPAMMRRFDRRVYIDVPHREDRIRFLKMKIAKNPALQISGEGIDSIAMRSTGMSLAELDSVVELALRSAIREGSTTVNDAILEEAFETFNGGEVKHWDASQLKRVARHEAGHAFLCFNGGETPSYLTIVARGNHGGYMQHAEQEGKNIYTKNELLARIRTSLGGRAAEIVYYGREDGISTGASGDLASATSLATQIVCSYGMDEKFGLAVLGRAAAGEMSQEIRAAVNAILTEQMDEAVRIISENRAKVDALVEGLMLKNYLTGHEIERVIAEASES